MKIIAFLLLVFGPQVLIYSESNLTIYKSNFTNGWPIILEEYTAGDLTYIQVSAFEDYNTKPQAAGKISTSKLGEINKISTGKLDFLIQKNENDFEILKFSNGPVVFFENLVLQKVSENKFYEDMSQSFYKRNAMLKIQKDLDIMPKYNTYFSDEKTMVICEIDFNIKVGIALYIVGGTFEDFKYPKLFILKSTYEEKDGIVDGRYDKDRFTLQIKKKSEIYELKISTWAGQKVDVVKTFRRSSPLEYKKYMQSIY